jgi:urease accessory protein UreF
LKPRLAGVRGNSAAAILSDIRLSRDHDARGFLAVPALRAARIDPLAAFMVDLASILHETQYTRLFRS